MELTKTIKGGRFKLKISVQCNKNIHGDMQNVE